MSIALALAVGVIAGMTLTILLGALLANADQRTTTTRIVGVQQTTKGADVADNNNELAATELRVVHMPGRMGGEATIGDTRITCRNVAGMVWAGDTVADLADDFGITRDQVRLACWWLVQYSVENDDWEWMARETWEAWAERWVALARNGDGDSAGDPTPEHQSDWATQQPQRAAGWDAEELS